MKNYRKCKHKITISTKMIVAVLFSILSVLLSGCDVLSGFGGNTPSAAQITSISYAGNLDYNGVPFLSISPDGKYAVIADREDSYLQILRSNQGRYEHYKDIYIQDLPDGFMEQSKFTINNLTDSDISWSNRGDKFTFSLGIQTLQIMSQSCIFICDIETGKITQLTGQEIEWDTRPYDENIWIVDYLPTWSDDDRTVKFARYCVTSEGDLNNQLCSIPAGGGSVKVEHSVDPFLTIWNLFNRGNALYYSTTSRSIDVKAGIFMFQNGLETVLVDSDVYFEVLDRTISVMPELVDVSSDGKTILYTFGILNYNRLIEGNDDNLIIGAIPTDSIENAFNPLSLVVFKFGSTFILANTSSPQETIPLRIGLQYVDKSNLSQIASIFDEDVDEWYEDIHDASDVDM